MAGRPRVTLDPPSIRPGGPGWTARSGFRRRIGFVLGYGPTRMLPWGVQSVDGEETGYGYGRVDSGPVARAVTAPAEGLR